MLALGLSEVRAKKPIAPESRSTTENLRRILPDSPSGNHKIAIMRKSKGFAGLPFEILPSPLNELLGFWDEAKEFKRCVTDGYIDIPRQGKRID